MLYDLFKAQTTAPTARQINEDIDLVLASVSGGKDSIGILHHLMVDLGIPASKIILCHQCVDGDPLANVNGSYHGLMDWPVTHSYNVVLGETLGLTTLFQWRDGGIEKELFRQDELSAGVYYDDQDGTSRYLPPMGRKTNTRRRWPAVSADLQSRWCSPVVKIDTFARFVRNASWLQGKSLLICTGERREESAARAKYKEVEPHRTNVKSRPALHWRPVIDYTEQQIWDAMRDFDIQPHPAYRLGYGRLSCMNCIFADKDQWASNEALDPERFLRIAGIEAEIGHTIRHKRSKGKVIALPVIEFKRGGQPFDQLRNTELGNLAMATSYPAELIRPAGQWELPAGAFKESGGPS